MSLFKKILQILSILIAIFLSIQETIASDKKTIGIILPANIPYYEEVHRYVLKRLETTIGEGKIDFLIQKPFPDSIALSNAARKLIALNVDIILCYGTSATVAALRERPNQPIIYVSAYSPAIERYRSKNITGVEFKTPVSSITRYLNAMKEINTIGVVYNPLEIDSVYQLNEILKCCPYYKISVVKLEIKSPYELKKIITNVNIDAIVFTTSSIANIAMTELHEHFSNNRIPVATLLPRREARPILSIAPSPKKQAEKAAQIIQRILKGEKPEEIKKDMSADIELIFDLGEARRLNLKIPADLITEATEVIY